MPDLQDPTTIKIGMPSPKMDEADRNADAEAEAFLTQRVSGGDRTSGRGDVDNSETPAKAAAKDGPARGEDGKFTSTKETAKPDAKSTDTTEPKATSAVPDGVNPDDYKRALKALQRDSVPSKQIDALDPSELVAWGIKRANAQAEQDRLGNEFAKLKTAKDKTAEQTDSEATRPTEPDYAALLEPLKSLYGDEIAEPLAALAKQIHESANKSAQDSLAKLTERFEGQERDQARTRLKDKYGLEDDARWKRVLESRKSDKNDYDSEYEAISAACRMEFADEKIAEYEAKLKEQHKLRDKGQTTIQNQKQPTKAKTRDEQEDELLGAILDGDTAKAQRLGRFGNISAGELMAQAS